MGDDPSTTQLDPNHHRAAPCALIPHIALRNRQVLEPFDFARLGGDRAMNLLKGMQISLPTWAIGILDDPLNNIADGLVL